MVRARFFSFCTLKIRRYVTRLKRHLRVHHPVFLAWMPDESDNVNHDHSSIRHYRPSSKSRPISQDLLVKNLIKSSSIGCNALENFIRGCRDGFGGWSLITIAWYDYSSTSVQVRARIRATCGGHVPRARPTPMKPKDMTRVLLPRLTAEDSYLVVIFFHFFFLFFNRDASISTCHTWKHVCNVCNVYVQLGAPLCRDQGGGYTKHM